MKQKTRSTTLLVFLLTLLAPLFTHAQDPDASVLRIYLARHGETDWNLEHRTQGQTDIPLNATGKRQAAELRTRMEGIPLEAVYSSALSRSIETADVARGTTRLTSVPGLNERNFGKFQTLPDNDPEFLRRRVLPDDPLDGGESVNAFYNRVRTTIEDIRQQRPTGIILIVGHLETNRMILRSLFNLTAEQAFSINQANNELYMIEIRPVRMPQLWKLIEIRN
jgi:2,3-bisphosphoglycerate-dependent phosphoglycerate mutase